MKLPERLGLGSFQDMGFFTCFQEDIKGTVAAFINVFPPKLTSMPKRKKPWQKDVSDNILGPKRNPAPVQQSGGFCLLKGKNPIQRHGYLISRVSRETGV